MGDTAMQAAKALIRSGSSQMEAGAELRRKRYAKNLGTTQADFDELSRYVSEGFPDGRFVSCETG